MFQLIFNGSMDNLERDKDGIMKETKGPFSKEKMFKKLTLVSFSYILSSSDMTH